MRQAAAQQHGSGGPIDQGQTGRTGTQGFVTVLLPRERAMTGIHSPLRDNHPLQHCHAAFYDEVTRDLVAYDLTGDILIVCEYEDLTAHRYQFVPQDGPKIHCGNCGMLIKVQTSPP